MKSLERVIDILPLSLSSNLDMDWSVEVALVLVSKKENNSH